MENFHLKTDELKTRDQFIYYFFVVEILSYKRWFMRKIERQELITD